MRFVGYDTCNCLIWTNGMDGLRKKGIPKSHNQQRCFGFINKPHIDKCDLVIKNDSELWFKEIEETEVKKKSLTHKQYVISKLRLIDNMFGIGLPTTCGYCEIYGPETIVKNIYGSYVQIFFAIKIKSNIIHHSLSWCFPHSTAVPLAITVNDGILIYNEDVNKNRSLSDAYLCAWGSSGGSKHASARNMK